MEKREFRIREIKTEEMTTPMGIDVAQPVFSWILEAEAKNLLQHAVRIRVGTKPGENDCWDSGRMETDRSIGIRYAGKSLLPCSRYYVQITVWGGFENETIPEAGLSAETEMIAEAGTWFETGLMDPELKAWDGARWIGAPEYMIASDTLSVFTLEAALRIEEGDRAGVVFGAHDRRLLNRYQNELLIEGENYIRYVLNVGTKPATLEIFRVGYAPEDRADKPFCVTEIRDVDTKEEIITEENKNKLHHLKIEVVGNGAYTWLDGHKIDQDQRVAPYGVMITPRVLNPLGGRDVTTFPRLNQAGFYVGAGTKAAFPEGLVIRNLREPRAVLSVIRPEGERFENRSIKGASGSDGYTRQEPAGPAEQILQEYQEVHDPSCHSLPMLRRVFTVEKELRQARLYATARGIYSCRVNGGRISDEYFAPGASQYDHHLMYQTYDITEQLHAGKNILGCILASGWWSDAFSFFLDNYNYWGDKPSFLAKLVLIYSDGTEEVIVTDTENWEYFGEGPCRYAGFFNGEHYDARREAELYGFFTGRSIDQIAEQDGADNAFADKNTNLLRRPEEIRPVPMAEKEPMFPGAAVWPAMNEREPELVGHFQAPVRAVECLTAKSMTEPRPGVYIYDLGQEIAGVPVLTFHEKKGQRITIRYAEMLYPAMERYGELQGLTLQANLREASNTDIYICAGEGSETFQPEFTFHGYRYIEITGVEKAPAPEEVKSLVLSSVPEITGTFECSDPLVNRFVQNVKYSEFNNFISIPTDCPQRNERMGWLGDTHVFCRTADLQSPVKNFYIRNLQAMRDLQRPDGRLPNIAPFGGGFGGQTYESAMILMVWELYQQYGDTRLIREYFPAMETWMDAMEREGLPGLPKLLFIEWLGDWLAPEPADPNLLFNAFHYRNAVIMEKFALLTDNREAAEKYSRIAAATRKYWNETFVDPETGMTRNADGSPCDVQGAYAIALSCKVPAEEYQEKMYAHLARKTKEADYTIRTGFFGTGPLNPMLSEGGYQEEAQKTITCTAYPSWLYPVTQGATTVWERWNSFTAEEGFGENNSMNSFDHYSLGSVVSWLYENVLGIRRDEENPGYKHFILQPEIGTFGYAKGGIDTPHGRIESAWKVEDGRIVYECTIPANTTAELILEGKKHHLGSGTYRLERNLFYAE